MRPARRAGLGAEPIVEIDRAFEGIRASPAAAPLWKEGAPYRRVVLARFPYVVFFEQLHDDVVVLAVAHARRRPGYWLARAKEQM